MFVFDVFVRLSDEKLINVLELNDNSVSSEFSESLCEDEAKAGEAAVKE